MTSPEPAAPRDASGASRSFRILFVAVYGVFAVSASARALVQILRDFDRAPLAYSLSLGAALTYVIITWLMARKEPRWGPLFAWILFELAGVLVVGTMSVTHAELFEDDTVWSHFGRGYGYVPLALPLIAGISVSISRIRARKMKA